MNNLRVVARENAKCVNAEGYMDITYAVMGMFCYYGFNFLSDTGNKGISWYSKEGKVGVESFRKEEKMQIEVDCNDLEASFEANDH